MSSNVENLTWVVILKGDGQSFCKDILRKLFQDMLRKFLPFPIKFRINFPMRFLLPLYRLTDILSCDGQGIGRTML